MLNKNFAYLCVYAAITDSDVSLIRHHNINHPKINKYILYFKTVSLKSMYTMRPCRLATEKYILSK